MKIRKILAGWYKDHKRDLPWRRTRDPYAIWVSEIILQQTRVIQGKDYYLRFMERFPDVRLLAGSKIEEVMRVWQGLGYYSRARHMHAAASQIIREYGGIFPSDYQEILKLKGIGPYTAAAIASIAFNKPHVVIDGNVHRVLARLFGLSEPPGRKGPDCQICVKAEAILDRTDPGNHNQALMEFGALVCLPANPACPSCPLQALCKAYALNRVGELPVRGKPTKQRHRYFHYFVLHTDSRILIRQRTEKDIWQQLFDLPLIETPRPTSTGQLMESPSWKALFGNSQAKPVKVSRIFKHTLTHQVIHAKFYHLDYLPENWALNPSFRVVPLSEISKFPVPKLIENYLKILMD